MSATYEAGTVAIATVRSVPNVRVFRTAQVHDDHVYLWMSEQVVDNSVGFQDEDVTDVLPLVVLDPSQIPVTKGDNPAELRGYAKFVRGNGNGGAADVLNWLADQIEARTKPRIPEPGLWAVVEAGHKHLDDGRRSKFVRVATEGRFQWVERKAEADWCVWDDLIDPVLIREGVES